MSIASLSSFLPVLSLPALAGTWKLEVGHALTLQPSVDAQLRVARGGLWLTLDVQRPEPGRFSGDIFLAAGEHICIPAGRVAVIEPWSSDSLCASYFSWDAVAADLRAPIHLASRWQLSVRQPLADMGAGLSQVGFAFGRLLHGLLGISAACVTGLSQGWRLGKA